MWSKLSYYITSYQFRPQGISSAQNFDWRYLENEKSFFKNLKTGSHHFESCFIWEIIIFYAGIPLKFYKHDEITLNLTRWSYKRVLHCYTNNAVFRSCLDDFWQRLKALNEGAQYNLLHMHVLDIQM